jgi:hypothetical protein
LRLWNSRRVLALLSAGGLALLALVAGGVYFVASPDFEQMAADYTLRTVRDRTGACEAATSRTEQRVA